MGKQLRRLIGWMIQKTVKAMHNRSIKDKLRLGVLIASMRRRGQLIGKKPHRLHAR